MQRRDFIKTQVLAGLGLASGAVLPGLEHVVVGGNPGKGRTLVVLELTGGNDGLNTVVPYSDDHYHRARPALAIGEGAVSKIDERIGWAPSLEGVAGLFADGHVALVQGVGMPQPDRSHFVSLDRWHSGDADGRGRTTGWLGRALDQLAPTTALPGLAMGDRALPRIFHGTSRPVASCERLNDLVPDKRTRRALGSSTLRDLDATWGTAHDRQLAKATRELLDALESVAKHRKKNDGITKSPLGRRLADTLALLRSDLDVPAVFVRTGGFDTHARQDQSHPQLLSGVDTAVTPFVRALAKDRLLDRVLIVVYSEFGRRVRENGSRGTDHGSGGPALLIGGGVTGGAHGEHPDLEDLDQGDVRTTCDFRRVLAQGLKHLGHEDPTRVLGEEGSPLF